MTAADLKLSALKANKAEIPDGPGCYIFKSGQKLLYVGKAKSLKKRLLQYLGGRVGDPKTAAMLERAKTVELIITANETEALLLEMTLIERLKPAYNITIHGFPYIKVTKEPFPRVFVTREGHDDSSGKYIGPFTDAGAIRRTVSLTNRAFRLRTCKYELEKKPPARPCLDYEMGKCRGPCAPGVASAEDYRDVVERAIRFIIGRRAGVVRDIEKKMREAAARLDFEDAAAWRDVLRGLGRAAAGQAVVGKTRTDADVFAYSPHGAVLYAVILKVREGRLVDRVAFKVAAPAGDPLEELVVSHYGAAGAPIPRVVAVPHSFPGRAAVAATLAQIRGAAVQLVVPRRGEGARLLGLAARNLEYFVETAELSRARRGELAAAFADIGRALDLAAPPSRVEMVDISHTAARETVGSLVRFVGGVPDKSGYRHYRVRAATRGDDLAAVAEVVGRRLARVKAGEEAPDLLLVDGGPTQLGAALAAAPSAGGPAVAAFAKDPDRLFGAGGKEPLALSAAARLFLARVRDEAHRFARDYHRKLRGRASVRSILDEVKGIGPVRRKALLKRFGAVTNIMSASTEEIAAVPGVGRRAAGELFGHLHGVRRERNEE